jgi:hypothetical protein
MIDHEIAKGNQFKELVEDDDVAKMTVAYLGRTGEEATVNAVSDAAMRGTWESMEVIMDSGAHICIGPPATGEKAGYKIEESPDSKAGMSYAAANGTPIPNLGQRVMAVMTEEGSIRGVTQQVGDVTKNLEAIRAVLKTGHAVVFNDDGLGNGTGSFMINKWTGETNAIRDDGSDYVMRRWIIPQPEVEQMMSQQATANAGFTRRGS